MGLCFAATRGYCTNSRFRRWGARHYHLPLHNCTLADPDDRMLQEVELWGLKNALVVCSLPLYPLLRPRRAKYVFVIRERALFIKTLFISIEDVEKRSPMGCYAKHPEDLIFGALFGDPITRDLFLPKMPNWAVGSWPRGGIEACVEVGFGTWQLPHWITASKVYRSPLQVLEWQLVGVRWTEI